MKTLLLAGLMWLPGVLAAQTFTEVTGTPFVGITAGAIAFADVDGDNDPDLLVTGRDAASNRLAKLYRNESGSFVEVSGTPFEGVHLSAAAFADVDGDQDLDVLIAGRNASGSRLAKLYVNDGTGVFSEVAGTTFGGYSDGALAFADVDGDGDQDVVITGYGGTLSFAPSARLFLNDGTGQFSEATSSSLQGVEYSALAFADVDGDTDPDLLIAGRRGIGDYLTTLYLNDGAGLFTAAATQAFPGLAYASVAFADIDGDSDPDLVINGQGSNFITTGGLYLNDGTGQFAAATSPFDPATDGSLAFADADGDGDQDLLLTGVGPNGAVTKLYANDGAGQFAEVAGLPFDAVHFSSVAWADVDGDQDLDVVLTGNGSAFTPVMHLYRNESGPTALSPALPALGFVAYPNPLAGQPLSLRLEATTGGKLDLQLLDLPGRVLYATQREVWAGENVLSLTLPALPRGTYLLRLQRGEQVGSQWVQVE